MKVFNCFTAMKSKNHIIRTHYHQLPVMSKPINVCLKNMVYVLVTYFFSLWCVKKCENSFPLISKNFQAFPHKNIWLPVFKKKHKYRTFCTNLPQNTLASGTWLYNHQSILSMLVDSQILVSVGTMYPSLKSLNIVFTIEATKIFCPGESGPIF